MQVTLTKQSNGAGETSITARVDGKEQLIIIESDGLSKSKAGSVYRSLCHLLEMMSGTGDDNSKVFNVRCVGQGRDKRAS